MDQTGAAQEPGQEPRWSFWRLSDVLLRTDSANQVGGNHSTLHRIVSTIELERSSVSPTDKQVRPDDLKSTSKWGKSHRISGLRAAASFTRFEPSGLNNDGSNL